MRSPRTRREKEIWEACDVIYTELQEANKITGDLIFSQLVRLGYKKGSPNEVYRYRKTWREEHGFEVPNTKFDQSGEFDHDSASLRMVLSQQAAQYRDIKSTFDTILSQITETYQENIKQLEKQVSELKEEKLFLVSNIQQSLFRIYQQCNVTDKLKSIHQLVSALETFLLNSPYEKQMMSRLNDIDKKIEKLFYEHMTCEV